MGFLKEHQILVVAQIRRGGKANGGHVEQLAEYAGFRRVGATITDKREPRAFHASSDGNGVSRDERHHGQHGGEHGHKPKVSHSEE
jgi:hypothetical protein